MSRPLQISDINPDDPFGEGRDVLGYSASADVLTTVVRTINHHYVLAVDAAWGRGKTIFLTQWMYLLKKQGFQCVYLNAWENDFVSDPLVAFLAEVRDALLCGTKEDQTPPAVQQNFERLKAIAPKLIRCSLRAGSKAATYGIIDTADAGMERTVADVTGNLTGDILAAYEDKKQSIDQFKDALQKWVSDSKACGASPDLPLIFIIDELDRCRPAFSVELLERLKHLFSVEGIVFVLGLDKEQLGHSVRAVYGDVDAEGFLRRFIDTEYHLPRPPSGRFVQYLLDRFEIENYIRDGQRMDAAEQLDALKRILITFSDIYSFSLRDLEKIVARLALIFRSMQSGFPYVYALIGMLVCVRHKAPHLFRDFRRKVLPPALLIESFGSHPCWLELNRTLTGKSVAILIECGFWDWDEALKIADEIKHEPRGVDEANLRVALLTDLSDYTSKPFMEYVVERIELTEDFSA